MHEAAQLTPMFRQYRLHKQNHPDAILLFRMGDFYEMFEEDAELASRLLELTLTARGKGTAHVVPMCGFPHHQLDAYTARLLRANQRVAICEQVEDPRAARGLVRREVVRIVTPGTINDPSQLDAKANLWLAGVAATGRHVGAAFLDASTGEFLAWDSSMDPDRPWDALAERLRAFEPREIVHPQGLDWPAPFAEQAARQAVLTPTDPHGFDVAAATATLGRQLGVATLDGFGLRERPAATAAAGGLLQYVQDAQRSGLEHIDRLALHEPARHLVLDPVSRHNLELERALRDGGRAGSLVAAVDCTKTSPGGRLLRSWLCAPLLDVAEIERRHAAVAELVARTELRRELRERLNGVHDIERLTARAVGGTATARDLLGLGTSLARLPPLAEALAALAAPLARQALDRLDPCPDVAASLAAGIADDPPASVAEGGLIRSGWDAELDELRAIRKDGRGYIASLETAEREATGIGSLKVRFNKVFGYYIEVSRTHLARVPDRYQRKQTIAGGERYVTPELKEHEVRVLNAQERIVARELELLAALRTQVASAAGRLKAAAGTAALLDVLGAFAELADLHGYCRPQITAGGGLRIVGGRHPVVERMLLAQRFVPNDTLLEAGGKAIAVLTGPNMGGKSTYLRQVALIVLLAQAGSFVPADEAELGIVDRIFCRVGASDSLAEGHSTFMVEMSETANILHHATAQSLLLLDEIGRGTATFDGLSIAWAVIEHLHAIPGGAPRTLFATHYHELTELAVELASVINLRMAVREWGERVVFLHTVEPGAADRSYGIHVARLAGLPRSVIERAEQILHNLERDEYGQDGQPRRARRAGGPRRAAQPSLFGLPGVAPADEARARADAGAEVLDDLRARQPERLTPFEALELIVRWREKLERGGERET